MQLSIVIPAFNEEESLPELHQWIIEVMQKNNFTYELIFVDDGSKDQTWGIIEELAQKDQHIHGIKKKLW